MSLSLLLPLLCPGRALSHPPNVHIQARVYLTDHGPETGLLAEPSLVVQAGKVAKLGDLTTLVSPGAYDFPRIPRALADKISGGGQVGERPPPNLPTHRQDHGIIPAFPKDFKRHQVGLALNFAPRIRPDGSLEVNCTVNQSILRGFSNRGLPLTLQKPGAPKKPTPLGANHQWMAETMMRSETLTFTEANFSQPIRLPKQLAETHAMDTEPNFASRWTEPEIPAVSIELTAARLPAPEKAPLPAPDPNKAQVQLSLHTVSTTLMEAATPLFPEGNPGLFRQTEFEALLSRLKQRKGSDLMSAPKLVTRSEQAGKVEVIREFIYPLAYEPADLGSQDDPKALAVTPVTPIKFQTENIGLTYQLTPTVLDDGTVEVDIDQRVVEFQEFLNFSSPIVAWRDRAFGGPVAVVLSENKIEMPVFSEQAMQTTLRLPSNSTAMLGGAILEKDQHIEDKIPLLGDLPLLGRLARSSKTLTNKQVIHIFLSAELIDPS